jgi:hypothetical protein
MSDRSPIDDPLVSFDQQQFSPTATTPTKQKANEFFENFSTKETDPFGNHNGNGTNQDEHHNGTNGNKYAEYNQFSLDNNLFPVDTNENEKGKLILK